MKTFNEILQERSYWGNNAAGIIIYAKDTGRILCLQRSNRVMEPNTWSITVSGKLDGNESPTEAAIREMHEELNYKGPLSRPEKIDIFTDKDDNGETFTFTTYLVQVPKEFTPKLNFEHRKAFWWDGKEKINGEIHFGTKRLLNKLKGKI